MKKSTNTKARKPASRQMTRREFVGGAVAAAAVFGKAPALLRGQNLNNKLDIAFIAAGGRANASMGELTINPDAPPGRGRGRSDTGGPTVPHPDENAAVICDINANTMEIASQRFPKARRETGPPRTALA
jgi:hypothetical protein